MVITGSPCPPYARQYATLFRLYHSALSPTKNHQNPRSFSFNNDPHDRLLFPALLFRYVIGYCLVSLLYPAHYFGLPYIRLFHRVCLCLLFARACDPPPPICISISRATPRPILCIHPFICFDLSETWSVIAYIYTYNPRRLRPPPILCYHYIQSSIDSLLARQFCVFVLCSVFFVSHTTLYPPFPCDTLLTRSWTLFKLIPPA